MNHDAPNAHGRAPLDLVARTFPTAAAVEISFSGGNDEGGPDEMRVLDAEGQTVSTISQYEEVPWKVFELQDDGQPVTEKVKTQYYPHEYEVEKVKERMAGPRYADAAGQLVLPIDAGYGSFAGSPYITGTLTWDLSTGRHTLEDSPSY